MALFAMLLVTSSASAQTTAIAYVDLASGSSGDVASCTVDSSDTGTANNYRTPCNLATALGGTTASIYVRVRREGDTVTLEAPTLDRVVTFGLYVRGSAAEVKGTIQFTGDFRIGADGQLGVASKATVHLEDVTTTAARTTPTLSLFVVNPAAKEKNSARRLIISGDLTTHSATIRDLTVSRDLTIKGEGDSPVLRVDSLTVNSGATLTVGTSEDMVDLRVPLTRSGKDLTVNGMIDGPGTVWIAHVAAQRLAADFHISSDYTPATKDGKIDKTDCVKITGSGEIKNEIRAIAAGNICVELAKITDLTVAGSIEETNSDEGGAGVDGAPDISTDIIFRNAVTIDGDVVQWNDARVVFEKTAIITGSVILDDGVLPASAFPAAGADGSFGGARLDDDSNVTSVRRGVRLASDDAADTADFTCEYRQREGISIVNTPVVNLQISAPAPPGLPGVGRTVYEDVGTVTIMAELSRVNPAGQDITVPLVVTGTATAGDDYSDLPDPFQITISSGNTTGSVGIDITDDSVADEDPETIIVTIGTIAAGVARKGANPALTITINNGDAPSPGNFFVDSGSQFFKHQTTGSAGRGFYVPGVQFEDAATIEGDLDVRSSTIEEEGSDRNRNLTICAPRVIFAAKPAGSNDAEIISSVEGDLISEQVNNSAKILLDSDTKEMKVSVHNLSVGGDIFVDQNADPIAMGSAASYKADGTCKGTDGASLKHGNYLHLSDANDHVISGSLTLGALVVLDDLEVSSGTLTVDALHIGEGAELEAENNVVVNNGLILQGGGVDGTLAASGFTHLTYASGSSDVVRGAATLEVLEIHLGSRRLRLEDVRTNVNHLGLCSGTLVLGEVETTQDGSTVQDSTLYITEKLVVQAGSFELDSSSPGRAGTDKDGYILEYKPSGEHTAGAEWFAPRKVAVNHKDAVIIVDESKALVEGVHIFDGHLHLKGDDSDLVIGEAGVAGAILTIEKGELHTNGNNVQVHGKVTVGEMKKVAKLMTDGGELHVLGRTDADKNLMDKTATATLNEGGVIDVGTGALQLGPEATNPTNSWQGDWQDPEDAGADGRRPHVQLKLHEKAKVVGTIRVPKGSKQTEIIGTSFDTIVFDGTKTPNKAEKPKPGEENWEGTLYIEATGGDKNITVDSLNASNGSVDFEKGKKATVTKDVVTSSAKLYQDISSLEFKGDLAISGKGGFSSRAGAADARKSVTIGGDFSQVTTEKKAVPTGLDSEGQNSFGNTPEGTFLSQFTDKTVAGKFEVSGKGSATRYRTVATTNLSAKGDFHFDLSGTLPAHLEFSGKESQKVKSVATLGNVTVSNAKGIALDSTVTQSNMATLTLSRGVISGDHDWVVTNRTAERNLSNSVRATENGSIFRSSRLSYLATSLTRSVLSTGVDSSAYLFPAGAEKDGNNYYRPLILQLGSDEASDDSVTVTVSPETVPSGATPSWPAENIRVPASGETLTLDAYADIFWRVEVGDGDSDELLTSPSIRVQAHGINNVFDADRLRIVQWDCDWSDARLAGQYNDGENDEDSFAFNGYIGGNLNLTQTGIALGSCSILGIAANGIENPIHLSSGSTVQQSRVQFIHNAVLPSTVNLSLDGTSIATGVGFQSATGYLTTTAGSHTATIAPAGAPESQWINAEFMTKGDQAYAVIAHGAGTNIKTKLLETRLTSSVDNMVEAIFVHGVAGAGDVNIRSFSPSDHDARKLLTVGLGFDKATRYIRLAPDFHNLEITLSETKAEVGVFSLNLNGYQDETLIIAISGGANVSMMAVDANGTVTLPANVTSTEDLELPTEFSLHGNYPNPFNPSTRIQFDLPESAQVSLQVVDMLGREVMALPAQDFEAGSNRSIELNATNLASGTYLYRMIANGAESRYVKTGRMTLVK